MMISGAVFVDKIIVQPLTDFVYLGGRDLDQRISHIAKIFYALNSGIDALSNFYTDLREPEHVDPSIGPCVDHLLPYINSYNDNGAVHHFRYTGMLRPWSEISGVDPTRAIFEAYLPTDKDRRLVVKFVRKDRYSVEAHKLLADKGLAPTLRYYADIPGGLFVVVMDLVRHCQDAHSFINSTGRLPASAYDDVRRAVDILHQHDLVFGDLRPANIMLVKEEGTEDMGLAHVYRSMLIDFDWCGRHGIATYPAGLNDTGGIGWHKDVVRGGIMRKEHDLFMLENVNKRVERTT